MPNLMSSKVLDDITGSRNDSNEEKNSLESSKTLIVHDGDSSSHEKDDEELMKGKKRVAPKSGEEKGCCITSNPEYGNNDSKNVRKQRKKRKTYSCDVCRKQKTRCDYEQHVGKCRRCSVLSLECSLSQYCKDEQDRVDLRSSLYPSHVELPTGRNVPDHGDVGPPLQVLDKRLLLLESYINDLHSKFDKVVKHLEGRRDVRFPGDEPRDTNLPYYAALSGTTERAYPSIQPHFSSVNPPITLFQQAGLRGTSHDHVFSKGFLDSLKLQEPPFKLVNDIDSRFFPESKELTSSMLLEKRQRPFVVARDGFMRYFNENEQLCLTLSKEFLVKSHFWIIPGGIKAIDRAYVEEHAFISSVFTMIAMGFDDNNKYSTEQELLYNYMEGMLTSTLTMIDRLTDHDIEAILYCSMFNVSRKAKRHRQTRFHSLGLSKFALDCLLTIIDFHKIKDRVLVNEEYNATDLYHLRILNSLSECLLQYSIGYGDFTVLDGTIREFNKLTAKFPQANFGDEIKISKINLAEIVTEIFLSFKSYFNRTLKLFDDQNSQDDSLLFPEIEYWLSNWDELLSKDDGGVLQFSYHFYYIMIFRTFLIEFYDEVMHNEAFYQCMLMTMKKSCFSLMDEFLRLPPALIKGAPVITLNQLVYACLTVYDFLYCYELTERQQVLNKCTKIYWHLNTIGEKSNEATLHVGQIIKSLIDTGRDFSQKRVSPNIPTVICNFEKSMTDKTFQDSFSFSETPNITQGFHTTSHSGNFSMPDVDKFTSFEDFFQNFFNHLKPTTQRFHPSKPK
ncbi:HCL659Wp [Eremothecium sinecaudum]|uniref:HCL659Wp n=1 Tax=Eremothecium sinecaudum TaxID=45286 RepID=A0A109UYI3_9SACH|nr:HCL659Wp [Eremothecium sinecaudum]AMD19492.1 HCL659Wp [Eremothecium sinecaudum]